MTGSKETGLLASIFRSIYDFKAYRSFKEKTTGKAFLYLLLLTVIFGGISSINLLYTMDKTFKDMNDTFDRDFPEFTLTENGLEVKGKMPIISKNKDSFYAIDTTGKIDKSVLNNHEKGIFISKTGIYYKKSIFETREYNFESLTQFAPITKSTIKGILSYSWIVMIIAVPLYLIYFYSGKIFSAFIIALLGLVFRGIVQSKEDLGTLFKLGLYAITLPVIIKVFIDVIPVEIPNFFLIYYLSGLGCLMMALRSIKSENTDKPLL